jgi:aryl-alcohol dehydrogenase-like predicted oxidoreductase
MEYRLLGSSGCAVSALAMGGLTFGNEADETEPYAQLDAYQIQKYERGHLERNWLVLDAVRKVAEQRGVSMGQVAIAWVLGRRRRSREPGGSRPHARV